MDKHSSLKNSMQENIFDAFEHGLKLPDGCIAFYDQQKECFIDAGSLKPLQGESKRMAVAAFDALTPKQQDDNKSYFTLCALYSDLFNKADGQASLAFNSATKSRPSAEAEPVSQIVRRIFSSLLAPKF